MDLQQLTATAQERFAEHGLVGWTFGLAGAKRRLGVCKYRRKRIEISAYYARNNPDAAVLDTLMHEIAHALAGPEAGHGPAWKAVAERLGATPRACDNSPDTVVQPGDWQSTCAGCGKTHHRYKRPTASGYRCRCPARSPLAFAFAGDPAREPPAPIAAQPAWQATCGGCATVHRRARQPKAGVWKCRCPHRGVLTWALVQA